MDTSQLFERLQGRIEETGRDRDRLSEAVEGLQSEIGRLESDKQTLKRLISYFQLSESTDQPESDGELNSVRAPTANPPVSEPIGHAREIRLPPDRPKTEKTWAQYKLDVADWYLATLVEEPPLAIEDRAISIEGVIVALCSSFDSAISEFTRTVERAAGIPGNRQTPGQLTSWSKLFAEARFVGIELASELSVSNALLGEHSDSPQGWLAQLLKLQNRSTRESLIINTADGLHNQNGPLIDVPTQGARQANEYLLKSRDLARELLETIFDDVSSVEHGKAIRVKTHNPRERAEQELDILLPNR